MGYFKRAQAGFLALIVWLPGFAQSAASLSDSELIEKGLHASAKAMFAPHHPIKNPEVPLQGTAEEYIRAIVHTNGIGEITKRQWRPAQRIRRKSALKLSEKPVPLSQSMAKIAKGCISL